MANATKLAATAEDTAYLADGTGPQKGLVCFVVKRSDGAASACGTAQTADTKGLAFAQGDANGTIKMWAVTPAGFTSAQVANQAVSVTNRFFTADVPAGVKTVTLTGPSGQLALDVPGRS
jgi:hypothetical protein